VPGRRTGARAGPLDRSIATVYELDNWKVVLGPDLDRAQHALAGDERRPAGRAALLAVGVGEPHPLIGDPVDVRRPVAHQPVAVTAQVGDPDVIASDHQDVGLGGVRPLV
jgi:hypothetical protein